MVPLIWVLWLFDSAVPVGGWPVGTLIVDAFSLVTIVPFDIMGKGEDPPVLEVEGVIIPFIVDTLEVLGTGMILVAITN